MNYSDLLNYFEKNVSHDSKITIDTRDLLPGDIFFAYSTGNGKSIRDGRKYITLAIEKKAGIIVFDPEKLSTDEIIQFKNLNCIEYLNLAYDSGNIACEWYSNNKNICNIIGITGTNGKTTITQWLSQILDIDNNIASIGTLGIGFPEKLILSGYTTPDAPKLQYECKKLFEKKINYLVMEVTSHALEQYRVNSINFKTAIFTNLTRDHLDYHNTMENYGNSKKKLFYFECLKNIIINIDDDFGINLVYDLLNSKKNINIWIFSLNTEIVLNFKKNISTIVNNINFYYIYLLNYNITKEGYICSISCNNNIINNVFLPVLGQFNISNCLAIISVLLSEYIDIENILLRISKLKPVSGRMEIIKNIKNNNKIYPLIIIDYAHTPDAIENVLKSLQYFKTFLNNKIWCIFGCGGNRDAGKRPIMGKIVKENSDNIIITSDNPRYEDPNEIINMIMLGIGDNIDNNKTIYRIEDRKKAIEFVINKANKDDIVLIAGKGHETTQEINGNKYYFSDKNCVYQIIN